MNRIICIVLLLLTYYTAFAQNQLTVSGVVTDGASQETIPGVTIYLKDRPGMGTTTDIDGKFSIKATRGDVIVFSSVGYETFEYLVSKDEPNLQVSMKEGAIMLEEAVVTGMGTTQRKVSVVGAISSVNVKELQTPGSSINNMIGGRIPGIISMQTSGEPGDDISEFWVRGIGTFGANSSALVLIDGLEGNLSDIDPADVESFSVLKDASATAVYGVRGANGVVLVTTKRGEEGKLQITGRANFTLSHITRMPEYVDSYDYALLANEARVVRGDLPLYSDMELTLIQRGLDLDLYPNIDWQKEIMKKNTYKQSYYASIRGGGKLARYFVSLGLSNEPAAYKQASNSDYNKNIGYNKYTFRSNIDINLTESTKIYFGSEGFYSKNTLPGINSTDQLWQSLAMLTSITIPKVYSTGDIPAYGTGYNTVSPYVLLNHTGIRTKEQSNLQITLSVEQDFSKILKGLRMRAQGAYTATNYFDEDRMTLPDLYFAEGRNVDGSLRLVRRIQAQQTAYGYSQDQYRKFFFESTMTYENIFADNHRVTGLLYYNISDHKKVSDILG
ncbi:MAG: SusC/RagA family TonB-linked outer membrane protein, partial [Bacteroidales bacterium]|nr:SusC/RagA family TonB-linked outer membrane protein [Bacteroidales bacterium]